MKKPSYGERRWRPIRWWEIAACGDPSRMPFLRHYPEPPAVLVAQILAQARGLVPEVAQDEPAPTAPEDPWGEDSALAKAWFRSGDQDDMNHPFHDTDHHHQRGPHA